MKALPELPLADGRRLGFEIFGPANAPPILYCHGWPSSRLEPSLVSGLPIRLIAFDRPGYGLSTPNPHASQHSNTQDVAALLDHLGLQTAPIVGMSGGGPLASACAYHLPGRITALALISAVPPPAAIAGSGLELLASLGRRPILGRAATTLARRILLSPLGERALLGRNLPGLDGPAMTPPLRRALLAAIREGVRPGGEGAFTDARLYGTDWGFSVTDITVPTIIWHGTEDSLVDPSAALAYAAIPGARLHLAEGHGHYSLILGHAAEIMADLLEHGSGATPDPG